MTYFVNFSAQGNISESIRRGFLALDEEMMKDDLMKDELAGTTAVIILLKGGYLYCVSLVGVMYI